MVRKDIDTTKDADENRRGYIDHYRYEHTALCLLGV
jgi:hypothetical protein